MQDALGARGEAIFYVLLTEFHSDAGPIFRPQFLGDKWPTVDYVVELLGADPAVPFFFVQVKTTRAGYTKRDKRLKVSVTKADMERLASFPAPTYIVGIDERAETGFLLSANGERLDRVASLPSDFPIDRTTRERLWNEVKAFWDARQDHPLNSAFWPAARGK